MGAFDHLEWTYHGAFEQLFGLGKGEFEQKFSKNSNARGVAQGWGMLKLRFDWYIKGNQADTVKEPCIHDELTTLHHEKQQKTELTALVSDPNSEFSEEESMRSMS